MCDLRGNWVESTGKQRKVFPRLRGVSRRNTIPDPSVGLGGVKINGKLSSTPVSLRWRRVSGGSKGVPIHKSNGNRTNGGTRRLLKFYYKNPLEVFLTEGSTTPVSISYTDVS